MLRVIAMLVAVLGLVGCGAPAPAGKDRPVTVIVPQTVVVRETVIVPQTVTVRETVVVAATAKPVPTATAKPPSKVTYEIGEIVTYRDVIDQTHFMTQISNTGNVPLGDTKIIFSLKDQDGKILGTATGKPGVNVLAPGEAVPVEFAAYNEPKGWKSYDFRVTTEEASDFILRAYGSKLETVQATMQPMSKQYRVTGEVKNTGDKAVRAVWVVVGLYDDAGQLVGTDGGGAEIGKLQPGESSPFDIEYIDVVGKPASFKVWYSGPVE